MSDKLNSKLIIALFIVAIVWGTTYLGIRVAVQTIPPWFVSGMRQCTALDMAYRNLEVVRLTS